MIDRQKAIEAFIRCGTPGACSDKCAYFSEGFNCYRAMKHDLLELLREQPQWISVKDRLPDDASDVLAYYDCGDTGQVMFVNYYKNNWYDAVFNDLIDDLEQGCITHWMSLPKPPEGVKQDG